MLSQRRQLYGSGAVRGIFNSSHFHSSQTSNFFGCHLPRSVPANSCRQTFWRGRGHVTARFYPHHFFWPPQAFTRISLPRYSLVCWPKLWENEDMHCVAFKVCWIHGHVLYLRRLPEFHSIIKILCSLISWFSQQFSRHLFAISHTIDGPHRTPNYCASEVNITVKVNSRLHHRSATPRRVEVVRHNCCWATKTFGKDALVFNQETKQARGTFMGVIGLVPKSGSAKPRYQIPG